MVEAPANGISMEKIPSPHAHLYRVEISFFAKCLQYLKWPLSETL